MTLLVNNFNGEQLRIMAEMHQEIQLLISLFIIAVRCAAPPPRRHALAQSSFGSAAPAAGLGRFGSRPHCWVVAVAAAPACWLAGRARACESTGRPV